jgi:hypothetical protein
MGIKSDLSPECQKFVKKLFAFFSKEKTTKKPIVSFDRVYQKKSKALGVSYTSVHRIMNGKRTCKWNGLKERANILNDFDHCVIKRTIHGLYSRKIAPTVSIIHKEIQNSIKISKSKLIEEFCTIKCILSMIGVIIWERSNLLGKQGMISCTRMKHGLTNITAHIICGFRMMGLMPQKYPRVKANVWLFSMQVREVRVWLTAAI